MKKRCFRDLLACSLNDAVDGSLLALVEPLDKKAQIVALEFIRAAACHTY